MPPSIASCLTLAFILWLFHRNSKRGPTTSKGLWVPTLWIAINASRPLGFWLNGGEGEREINLGLDGSPIDRNGFLFLIFLGLIILMRRRIDWRIFFASNRPLLFFYLYLLISVVWSGFPFVAFKRYLKDVGNIVMILIILSENDPLRAIQQVFVRSAQALILLSVLLIKYYPDTGRYYDYWSYGTYFCGATTNKNSLGLLTLFSGLFLLWNFLDFDQTPGWYKRIKKNLPELLVLLLCVWVLSKAGSATSLVCFAMGTGALFGARLVRTRPKLLVSLASGAVMVSVLFLTVPDLRAVVTGSLGRRSDLTERTDIWKGVIALKTNPLIGEGFSSFWLTPGGRRVSEELNVPHAHNGYLETYLNSGVLGVLLLFGVLFRAGRNTIRQVTAGSIQGYLYAGILLSGIIYNYTEVTFNNSNVLGFLLFLAATQYQPGWAFSGGENFPANGFSNHLPEVQSPEPEMDTAPNLHPRQDTQSPNPSAPPAQPPENAGLKPLDSHVE